MSPYIKALPFILAGVLLNAFAQIAMKKAVQVSGMEWSFGPLVRLFLHPWMLVCLGCYAVSVVLYAAALHLVPVNYAYPFIAFGFVANAFMTRWFLGETIPPLRWLALAIIVVGVGLQVFSGTGQKAPEAPPRTGR